MTGWKRILRGMLGMGLVFGIGVGTVATLFALFALLFLGATREIGIFVVGSTIWASLMGVVFGGALAALSRGRNFDEISLPKATSLGVLGGLAAYALLALNAWDAWTIDAAITNAVLLTGLGTVSAGASLLIARKAAPALTSPEETAELESPTQDRLPSGTD